MTIRDQVKGRMFAPTFDEHGEIESFWLPLFNNYQSFKDKNPDNLKVIRVFRHFNYGRNKPTLMFELEGGITNSLGWSSLVSEEPTKEHSDSYKYKQALRRAIDKDKTEFRNKNNTGRCTNCGIPYTKSNPVNVDHAAPMTFKTIVELYGKIHAIEADKKGSYKLKNKTDEQEFREFHNKHATLRLICYACHKIATYKK